MPFKKIYKDPQKDKKACLDPEHNPPTGICLEPGIYEYSCPRCGATKIIRVPRITA